MTAVALRSSIVPGSGPLAAALTDAVGGSDHAERKAALLAAYRLAAQGHNRFDPVHHVDPEPRPLPHPSMEGSRADRLAEACLTVITDPSLRRLPLVGTVDQAADSTDILSHPTRARALHRLYDTDTEQPSPRSAPEVPFRAIRLALAVGTGLSAILYLLTAAVVMGLVPHHTLVGTGSPFVNAFDSMFPGTPWAGKFIAAVAVVSGIGALNGWTLLVTETSRAIAQDDLFPRPFAWEDRGHTAWFGIVVGTILPSLLMLWAYETKTGLTVFTYLVDLTVVTVAIPYFMSAIAQLTFLASRRRRVQGWLLARDLLVAGISVLFSMWVTFASGYQTVYQALVVIMVGLILYAPLNARRQRLGETASPVDNPLAGAGAGPNGNGATVVQGVPAAGATVAVAGGSDNADVTR